MAVCKACGAPIVWIKTVNGKNMPCDEGLVEYWNDCFGNTTLVKQNGETIKCSLSGDGKANGMARIPHWSTCPSANKFRRK